MKKSISKVVVFVALISLSFQCEDMNLNEATTCIDPKLIKPDAMCTMIYSPVCGCDGKTYGNDCFARNSGVTKFTTGECEK